MLITRDAPPAIAVNSCFTTITTTAPDLTVTALVVIPTAGLLVVRITKGAQVATVVIAELLLQAPAEKLTTIAQTLVILLHFWLCCSASYHASS
jgi:hypothetical protein